MPEELSDLTVPELKEKLKSKKFPINGKKADLVKRLERDKKKKKELEEIAENIGVSKSGTKAEIITRIEKREKAKEGGKESDEREVPIIEPSDSNKEIVEIIGITAIRLSAARQLKVLNGLRWVDADSKYDSMSRNSLNFGGTIEGKKIQDWFPDCFKLDGDEGDLKVLGTKYTKSHNLPFKFSVYTIGGDGDKLELTKPNSIGFIHKPTWLDDINKDGVDKWDYIKNDHKCILVLIFLTNKEVDLRLIFGPDFEGLETDFPLKIRDGIKTLIDEEDDSKKGFFVQNEGGAFEWKYCR